MTESAPTEPTDDHPVEAAATAPGERLIAKLPGYTIAEKIDALHAARFVGSRIAADTEAWNLVHAFTQEVKALIAEFQAPI